MPSKPTDIREEIHSLLECLSDPSPHMRIAAARQLADFSDFMLPFERPFAMLALRNMIAMGQEQSDFLFGLHSLGKIASGRMPMHVNESLPFTKKDAVQIVFDSCSLGWVSGKLGEQRTIKAAVKAISMIAGGRPEEIKCKLFEGLSRKSRVHRMIALTSIFALDMAAPEAISKAAFSTLDPDHEVRSRAQETYRKISRSSGHPLRAVALSTAGREARNAAEHMLSQDGKGAEPLKRFAVASFLLESRNSEYIVGPLLERGLLSEREIEKHSKAALGLCYTPEMEGRAIRRKKHLLQKASLPCIGQIPAPPPRVSALSPRPARTSRPDKPKRPSRPSRPAPAATYWASGPIKA